MSITRADVDHYCLSKKGTSKDYPFDANTVVYRVMGKLFVLSNETAETLAFNLKCEPDWALALRDMYAAVQPGYHMNKRHWNTVTVDGSIPEDEFWAMIDHSYDRVVKTLKKAEREELTTL